ncbi:MAG: ferredoxin--NADP reductase [Coriobacteriia bacterium]
MEAWPTILIDSSYCGSGTMTFRFEKPEGYAFTAGQFTMLEVQCEVGPVRKPFTIASAPEDPWLEFTTRLSESCFKQALAAMHAGDRAAVSAAAGRLVLPAAPGPVGFLVGGVGVTPAHSILRHNVIAHTGLQAVLFYGNRDIECMPYAGEFDAMSDHGVRTIHVLESAPEVWNGESGFITADMVRRHVDSPETLLWVTAGPPAMTEAMVRVFDALGIPEERRMIERFTGYV